MRKSELDAVLREVQEEGFDDCFADFCGWTYSLYEYPPENFAPASMHAFYLREALDRLTSFPIEEPSFPLPEDVLEAASCYASLKGFSPDSPRQMSWALGWACYQACLREEGEDFCRLFISSWCRYYKR